MKIIFDFMNGEEVFCIDYVENTKITEPEKPVREGYVFEGWYNDLQYNTQFDFNKSAESDKIVYAKWKPSKQEPTFTEYNDKKNKKYKVQGLNRLAPHSDTVIPYQTEMDALIGARDYKKEISDNIQFLTGENALNIWDFTVVKNVEMSDNRGLTGKKATKNFFAELDYKYIYEDSGGIWKNNVPVPMSWTMYGDYSSNFNTPTGKDSIWNWDYPIYQNVIMPWQESEAPKSNSDIDVIKYGEAPVKYNPIGFYRTNFVVEDTMYAYGDKIRISFQGLESAYYVFVNGKFVGYSQDSFRPHEFDITEFLNPIGEENLLAVRVHKFSDATWLEDQDMIYDGGIFRDVFLISVPNISIEDYKVETIFNGNYETAELVIKNLKIKNNTQCEIQSGHKMNINLYDFGNLNKKIQSFEIMINIIIPPMGIISLVDSRIKVTSPKLWSAEKPNLYLLSLNLSADNNDSKNTHVAQLLGFREITFTRTITDNKHNNITDTYDRIKINGQPLLMKGTNRHDTDPFTGRYVSKEVYETDLKIMKQYNVNTIRTSHYGNDEYLYYLADVHGMYIMGETNLECHAMAERIGDEKEYYDKYLREIFIDRTKTSYQTLKNRSSIICWSTGNECGSFEHATDKAKAIFAWMVRYFHDRDATRFVHSEFASGVNSGVDIYSNMYPSFKWTEDMSCVNGKPTDENPTCMPYFLCEYVHAMGNAAGSIKDYWDIIRAGTNMIGACVWDWVDQSRVVPLTRVTGSGVTDAQRNKVEKPWNYYNEESAYGYLYKDEMSKRELFYGYGGDYGDINNYGSFCGNGLVAPDRQVKPELYEIKYQYQNFWMIDTPIMEQGHNYTTEKDLLSGRIKIYNESNFTDFNEYCLDWDLKEDGLVIAGGLINELPSIPPKTVGTVGIDYLDFIPENFTAGAEYQCDIKIKTKRDNWFSRAGHVVAYEQFVLPIKTKSNTPMDVSGEGVMLGETSGQFVVSGNHFSFVISKLSGIISDYVYDGETIIEFGPIPNYWRAPHANDKNMNPFWKQANSSDNIKINPEWIKAEKYIDGRYVIDIMAEVAVGEETAYQKIRYIIDSTGAIIVEFELDTTSMTNDEMMLKVGSEIKLDGSYENIMWYGNGVVPGKDYEYGYKYPLTECYIDRCSFAVKGIYTTKVSDMYFPHMETQETGTVNGVRWVSLSGDVKKTHLLVCCANEQELEMSALHFGIKDFDGVEHPYEFQNIGEYTYLNIDFLSNGIGNASCGPEVKEEYKLEAGKKYKYQFVMIPTDIIEAKAIGEISRKWKAVPNIDMPSIEK